MKSLDAGGGWQAVRYAFRKAWEAGGLFNFKFYRALRSKNTCKTCALGMGGQHGGMVNERGSFPEVCKKSIQAMAADMQPAITANFWTKFSVAQMSRWTPRQLETSGRLIQPVLYEAGETHFRTITWIEAFERITAKLKTLIPDETFWYFSGRSSNEAGFLLQLLARVYGTNNVNNCSYFCHQASGVGLSSSIGTGTATIVLDDLDHADTLFVIGGNPPSNHPRLMTTMMHLRRRGGKVVVINPVRELGMVRFKVPSDAWSMLFGTEIATHFVQPHIGGDLALLTGISKAVVEMGSHDIEFLKANCNDLDGYLASLNAVPWSEIIDKCGVAEATIREIAKVYSQSKASVFSWTMGITHHVHGVENVQAIVNLALLRGMIGKPGAGVMPIRGHSNIQGIGSVGVTPKLKDELFKNLTEKFGIRLPTSPGLDTLACVEAAYEQKLKFGLCLGGNLFGSCPDAKFASQALSRLEMLVMLSTTLNTGHANGLARETIILPVLARDEEPEPTTQESMFNYVRLSDGGPRRLPGPRSEVQVIAELGRSLLGQSNQSIDWSLMEKTHTIRQWIAKVVPGFAAIESIDQTKKEFQIEGRTFHDVGFKTANGRANLFSHNLPPLFGGENQLRMMTVRSEGQFNTVVYEDYDLYRHQDRRDVILLHPSDMQKYELTEDELITIRSSTGEMRDILARSYSEIRAGNALMYYPESNVLVPRTADPKSKTPSFKCVLITLEKQSANSTVPSSHF
ncbi:MAG: FdhF/YdeP family oxidoreductase [Pirellulaceae bacterium]|nr:FdhF/YdeP family oxidoreductase [Pirellulaceae bacterium]